MKILLLVPDGTFIGPLAQIDPEGGSIGDALRLVDDGSGNPIWQPVPVGAATPIPIPTVQYPFGNGAIMGSAGDWLAASPDFNGTVLRWKARFLNAARAQVTGSATFSVKKVQEAGGALVDMVGGVLTIATDDENTENGGSASGWTVPGFLADDELIVTLETLTNPNSATSLLFTLTLVRV